MTSARAAHLRGGRRPRQPWAPSPACWRRWREAPDERTPAGIHPPDRAAMSHGRPPAPSSPSLLPNGRRGPRATVCVGLRPPPPAPARAPQRHPRSAKAAGAAGPKPCERAQRSGDGRARRRAGQARPHARARDSACASKSRIRDSPIQPAHEGVTRGLGQDRGGGDGQAFAVALHDGLLGCLQVFETAGVEEDVLRGQGKVPRPRGAWRGGPRSRS